MLGEKVLVQIVDEGIEADDEGREPGCLAARVVLWQSPAQGAGHTPDHAKGEGQRAVGPAAVIVVDDGVAPSPRRPPRDPGGGTSGASRGLGVARPGSAGRGC